MRRKSRRAALRLACGAGLGGAAALTLAAFRSDLVFFMVPSQILAHPPAADPTVRLGGMVVAGSVAAATVAFAGLLPHLFRGGPSVVALGTLGPDGVFHASQGLAKHDETYMPREVADALRRSGAWDPRFGKPPGAAAWKAMGEATR